MQLDLRIVDAHKPFMPNHIRNARAMSAMSRRPTNVTLPEALLREARDLSVNLSQACEQGLIAGVADARRHRWLADNQEAIQAWNRHVEEHGLPLAEYRQF